MVNSILSLLLRSLLVLYCVLFGVHALSPWTLWHAQFTDYLFISEDLWESDRADTEQSKNRDKANRSWFSSNFELPLDDGVVSILGADNMRAYEMEQRHLSVLRNGNSIQLANVSERATTDAYVELEDERYYTKEFLLEAGDRLVIGGNKLDVVSKSEAAVVISLQHQEMKVGVPSVFTFDYKKLTTFRTHQNAVQQADHKTDSKRSELSVDVTCGKKWLFNQWYLDIGGIKSAIKYWTEEKRVSIGGNLLCSNRLPLFGVERNSFVLYQKNTGDLYIKPESMGVLDNYIVKLRKKGKNEWLDLSDQSLDISMALGDGQVLDGKVAYSEFKMRLNERGGLLKIFDITNTMPDPQLRRIKKREFVISDQSESELQPFSLGGFGMVLGLFFSFGLIYRNRRYYSGITGQTPRATEGFRVLSSTLISLRQVFPSITKSPFFFSVSLLLAFFVFFKLINAYFSVSDFAFLFLITSTSLLLFYWRRPVPFLLVASINILIYAGVNYGFDLYAETMSPRELEGFSNQLIKIANSYLILVLGLCVFESFLRHSMNVYDVLSDAFKYGYQIGGRRIKPERLEIIVYTAFALLGIVLIGSYLSYGSETGVGGLQPSELVKLFFSLIFALILVRFCIFFGPKGIDAIFIVLGGTGTPPMLVRILRPVVLVIASLLWAISAFFVFIIFMGIYFLMVLLRLVGILVSGLRPISAELEAFLKNKVNKEENGIVSEVYPYFKYGFLAFVFALVYVFASSDFSYMLLLISLIFVLVAWSASAAFYYGWLEVTDSSEESSRAASIISAYLFSILILIIVTFLSVQLLKSPIFEKGGMLERYESRINSWSEPTLYPHSAFQVNKATDQLLKPSQSLLKGIPNVDDDFALTGFLVRVNRFTQVTFFLAFIGVICSLFVLAYRNIMTAFVWSGFVVAFAGYLIAHGIIATGMNLQFLPVMGQPFPFLGRQGSFLLFYLMPAFAVVLMGVEFLRQAMDGENTQGEA